ncbi:MAG: DNA/RNA non-specific endonuclease [Saprospiraceae bacterium]|nr:DNA/RNA non-specific endonuclease [Saprospiraceae bacterium]
MARKSSSDSGGFIFKTGLFAILAGLAFWIFNKFGGEKTVAPDIPGPATGQTESVEPPASSPTLTDQVLPLSTTGAIVRHTYYTLSYSEDHEQAEWVVYELNRDRLNQNWVERDASFRPDPAVRTESATPNDYRGSGYDRGHLVPAADMAFNELAMSETFFMSNMSPQLKAFNGGVWRELEECTRDWARRFKLLYVVTGPVLSRGGLAEIGFSKVTVPSAFYKVLLAPDQGRAIAFILPNELSDRPLMEYATTIDQVEQLTGIDFFPQVLKGLNEELEGSLDKNAWPIDSRRYQRRLQEWNRR